MRWFYEAMGFFAAFWFGAWAYQVGDIEPDKAYGLAALVAFTVGLVGAIAHVAYLIGKGKLK